MKKITKLTKEQEREIPIYIKKWVDLASQPIDRKKTLDCIGKIYKEKYIVLFTESLQNTIDLIDDLKRELDELKIKFDKE